MPITFDEDEIRELADDVNKINQQNYQYYQEHLDELQNKYAGDIIAIHENQVIECQPFTGDLEDFSEFIDKVRESHGREVAKAAYITQVPDPDQMLLL